MAPTSSFEPSQGRAMSEITRSTPSGFAWRISSASSPSVARWRTYPSGPRTAPMRWATTRSSSTTSIVSFPPPKASVWTGSPGSGAAGRKVCKTVPCPGRLGTSSHPPSCCMIPFELAAHDAREERCQLRDRGIQIDALPRRDLLPGEGHELAGEVGGALGEPLDVAEGPVQPATGRNPKQPEVRKPHDPGQHV